MFFKIYYFLTYPLTLICLFLIFIYRKVLTHGKIKSCHFLPTCSKYAWDSIREFGVIWGGILTIKRLVKCNPKNKGEVDFPKLNLLGNYKWKC
ncbi:MAG: membrane protein insertion efficiency factor YidD [Clostridia bacterium]|nr:membrane protein insertion efficiency factor YidD [Clostridia bacterium]